MSNELSLGLSDLEEKVYKTLLVSGQLSIGELRVTTSRNLDELTTTINSLITKNLIREIPGLKGRYASLLPIGSLKDDLLASVDDMTVVERELLDSAGVALGQLQTNLDSQEKELQESLNAKISDINSQFEQYKTNFQGQSDTIKNKIINSISEIKSSNNSVKDQSTAKIRDKNTAYETKINLVFENFNAKFNERTANLRNELTEEITNALESIKPMFQESVSSSQQANNESAIKINNVFTQNLDKFQEKGKSYVTESSTYLKESSDTLNNTLKQTNEGISILEEHLGTQVNQHRTDVDTFKTQLSTSFDEITEDLGNLEAEFSNQMLQIETNHMANGEEINNKARLFVEDNNEKFATATGELQSSLNVTFDSEINKFKLKIEDHYQRMISETLIQLEEFKGTLTSDVTSKMEQINSSREDMRLSINESLNTSITSLNETIKNSSVQQKQLKDGFFKSLSDKYNANKTKSSGILDNISANIQGLIDTISSSSLMVKTQIAEQQTKTTDLNAQFVEKQDTVLNSNLSEALNEISNLLGHELDSLNQLNEELSNAHLASFQETITNINSVVTGKVADLETTLKKFHNTFISNMKQTVEDRQEETPEGLEGESPPSASSKSIQTEVHQFLNEISSEVENLSEITHTALTSFMDSIQSDTTNLITESQTFITDENEKLKGIGVSSLDQVKAEARRNQTGQMATVKGTMDQYTEKYSTSSRSVTDKTLSLATVLEKLFAVQQVTETPMLNTSHLVGKDAIMYQLEDIVKRVKSKVTILIPSIEMINVEQIQSMKSTAQVNIISHIDEHNDKDWIDKMHNSDANVTLRSITKTGFGGELPNFIGVEREGEEILLGTMDDGANEYVAITSSSEYFVKILGNIVIADYARGKSKQLQK
ncbi:MAG: hypothetical protein GPJ54_13560 [Candidatus Heimdallarchaeota archaeon]|nr:hypothetical protein [Candidatus Heimdallarchaeota archaeon]